MEIAIKQSSDNEDDDTKNKDIYPGLDIDKADEDKVSPELVKQWTSELNNNPRNDGKIV